ncbi:DNA-directed RNA polymerase subunit beta' [Candidatus Saccharibacteria bacterium]|nr:DNA-directed RNA polymerase subunit beta' [Candidatus Saccharibacteria bacterium]
MRRYSHGTNIADFDAVRLAIANPSDILEWSNGEITKPETINYRTQKPEKDGLFCEKIFGPVKDINPHDAKYKGLRSREAAVDKKGEIVTKSIVRRERMGHISLATPVTHIWFLRGTPSAMGLVLNMTVKNLERIAYFASYVILSVKDEARDQMIADKEAEAAAAKVAIEARYEQMAAEEGADIKALAEARTKELDEVVANYEMLKAQLESLQVHALISENDYRNLPDELQDLVKVAMGGEAIQKMLENVDLDTLIEELTAEVETAKGMRKKKIMKRMRILESMQRAGIKPSSMCLSVLPVIPPDLRPMVQLTGGRFATSDLNDLYRRVINRNNRLKKLIDLNAPEVIRRNEMRMLQEAVDALVDNNAARSGRAVSSTGQRRRLKSLSDMLKGKQGRFRQNLLGKRVDYSGRSVIVAGPELKINQCGLPKMMALELFKPFVIGYLITNDHAHNIRSATRLIESGEYIVWDALDEVIKGKYVLLNRAPTLHRLGIQAFQPKLIEGKAIQLHPLVCKGFNADFDGDQMAVHLPLSDKAQDEAREIMASSKNILKPADGTPVLHIEQDIVLGAYYLTYEKIKNQKEIPLTDVNEALMALDEGSIKLQTPISLDFRGEKISTTLGRVLFNELLPADFPYQNEAMTKKKIQKVMAQVYEKYGQDKTAEIADELKDLAFEYSTISGLSMGMDDFPAVAGFDQVISEGEQKAKEIGDQYEAGFMTDDERYRLIVENWTKADSKVQSLLADQLKDQDNSMSIAVNSGARGNIGQMKQSVGMLGVLSDTSGRAIELPVKSSYKEGLDQLEYFTGTRGVRKALIDIALKTADSGYMTRRLVDVSQDVFIVDEEANDPGFPIYRVDSEETGVPFASRLEGRYAAEPVHINKQQVIDKGELITRSLAADIEAASDVEVVKIMSPLTCGTLRGVSQKSYGLDPATGQLVVNRHPVGVIAAQSIGEPGTQLSLDSKHRSGAVLADETAQGLHRVDELFEVRTPKGQAYITEISGEVSVREEGEQYIVQISGKEEEEVVLKLGERTATIADGQEVVVGDVVATLEGGESPLVAPITGAAQVLEDKVVITPTTQTVVRYEIPGFKQLVVKNGDFVVTGDRLTSGSINLHDLMNLKGVVETQRYILNQISKIFAAQGQNISDKHLEIVIRQMFSRVSIEEPGDTDFVTGDIVSKAAVLEANQKLSQEGKKPAEFNQLLLGITKVSTWADSFLSAASFQDTTRVLIAAATSGKVDHLYGLKENVILGRKIPVGTGYTPKVSVDEEE